MNLKQVANELRRRLSLLFLTNESGVRPCYARGERFVQDPHWCNLVLFYEYFHGDTGRGCGASHQTGWTALVARLISGFRPGGASGADSTTVTDFEHDALLSEALPPSPPRPAASPA
jgi:hypothetical protein